MTHRLRNRILIWIIALGLANFLLYTVIYAYLGGDAINGKVVDGQYFVRGHFLRYLEGHESPVSRTLWIYSYLHSISVWPTIGAVLCSMLVLSRPHILATMREDLVIRGNTFVTIAMTLIVVVTAVSLLYFSLDFISAIRAIAAGQNVGA